MNKVGWIVASLLVSGAVLAEPFSPSDKEHLMEYGWGGGFGSNKGIYLSGHDSDDNWVTFRVRYKDNQFLPYFTFELPLPCYTFDDENGEPILADREFRLDGKTYPAKKLCYTYKAKGHYSGGFGARLTPASEEGYQALYEAFKNNEYVTVDFIFDKAVFWSYGFDKITRKKSQQQ